QRFFVQSAVIEGVRGEAWPPCVSRLTAPGALPVVLGARPSRLTLTSTVVSLDLTVCAIAGRTPSRMTTLTAAARCMCFMALSLLERKAREELVTAGCSTQRSLERRNKRTTRLRASPSDLRGPACSWPENRTCCTCSRR